MAKTLDAASAQMQDKKTLREISKSWIGLLGPFIMLILAVLIPALTLDNFFTQRNIINIILQASIYIPLVIGMTFVITGGGIDLSVGAQVALVGVIVGSWLTAGTMPVWMIIVGALVLGTLLGTINGLVISWLKIPDFIVTLAFMEIWRGLALVHSSGSIWHGFPEGLRGLSTFRVLDVLPLSVFLVFALVFFGAWMYRNTHFGRYAVAIGCNRDSATTIGINVARHKVFQYGFLGLMCGIASLLLMSRIDSAQATMATGYEIHVIAATIIGGTSIFGGKGNIWGALIGALILAIIANALILANVQVFWRLVATGFVILLAVTINMYRERNAG